jgi:hypothetical protein
MQEFVCPDGTMSVNGVCRMFMTPNQREELKVKPKSFDEKYESIEDIPKGFSFDFEKIGGVKETADNMISNNMNYYNDFVEKNLGIPSSVQTAARFGVSAYGAMTGGSLASVAAPFAIPFMVGGALKAADNRRVQNITMQDPQGTINTPPARIMNIQPTPQDIYRGGGGDRPSPSPAKTSQGVTSAQHAAFRS